jgi:ankyrin repeat protein
MKLLVSAGVPVNGRMVRFGVGFFETGRRALHMAAGFGELDTVLWLLDHAANPNQRGIGVQPLSWLTATPAMFAAGGGHVGVLDALYKAGANLNATVWSYRGRRTARDWASASGQLGALEYIRHRAG